MTKHPVIAIGLDAAEPKLIETWIEQGRLPNLKRLRDRGGYARLSNHEHYRAETPWTNFLTGCSPEKTGYWGPVKYFPKTYEVVEVGAYDYQEYQPFYALGDDYRIAVFDIPQSALSEQANGPQVLAWGAHSPQTKSESRPPGLLKEMIQKHGKHPVLLKDFADCRDFEALAKLQKALMVGIQRRAAICQDLIRRENPDFFLTIFGETHTAGHYMWHLSQPHPISPSANEASGDALLEVFQETDRAIGDILSAAPEDAYFIVFSAHGMDSNVMDLPSMIFLPELLYRWSFPGTIGLGKGTLGKTPPAPLTRFHKRGWYGDVWGCKYDANWLRGFLRREAPTRLFDRIAPFLGRSTQPDLESPYAQIAKGDPLFWQPANWYKSRWQDMKAFALPSFSEGYVRINLKGREANGIVAPEEYDAVCDEISQMLHRLTDARTGQPMVREIVRTRASATDSDDKRPDADLIVLWQEENATDVVDSPDVGRIGPIPFCRTGSHRADGFILAQGEGIAPGSDFPASKAIDLAPTMMSLLGAPIPAHFEGQPIPTRDLSTPVA